MEPSAQGLPDEEFQMLGDHSSGYPVSAHHMRLWGRPAMLTLLSSQSPCDVYRNYLIHLSASLPSL